MRMLRTAARCVPNRPQAAATGRGVRYSFCSFYRGQRYAHSHHAEPSTIKSEHDASDPASPDSLRSLTRLSMRSVAHPVAIIRASCPSTKLSRSLVVSSFNVVSMDAADGPIVSFNIKLPSAAYDLIRTAGAFEVHFPHSRELCERVRVEPQVEGEAFSGRTVFGLQCRWEEGRSVRVADHVVMIGRVVRVEREVDAGSVGEKARRALNYVHGDYVSVGKGDAGG